MANSKITLDADNGKVDTAARKTAKEVRSIATAADAINSSFERLGKQLVTRVAGLTAMLTVVRSIGDSVAERQSATAAANTTKGGRTVALGQSIRALGLDAGPGGAEQAFREVSQLTGNKSADEVAGFLGQLAARQQTSKQKLKPGDVRQLASLFSTGLFTDAELNDATDARSIAKLSGQTTKRQNALTPDEQIERRLRFEENTKGALAESSLARDGIRRRGAQADRALYAAENPTMAGVGSAVRDAANVVGLGGAVDAATNAIFQSMNVSLARIAANTANRPQPTLSPTTEGGP